MAEDPRERLQALQTRKDELEGKQSRRKIQQRKNAAAAATMPQVDTRGFTTMPTVEKLPKARPRKI